MTLIWLLTTSLALAADSEWQPLGAYSVLERDTLRLGAAEGLLKSAPRDSLYVDVGALSNVAGLAITDDGALTYTARESDGRPVFTTFGVRDREDPSYYREGRLLIEVKPVNDPPNAASRELVFNQPNGATITLPPTLDDYAQFDAAPPTFLVTSPPKHGSVTYDAEKSTFNYIAGPDFPGGDHFVYEARDHAGLSASGTITVYARYGGSPPTLRDGGLTDQEDAPQLELDLLRLATDPDSKAELLNVSITAHPQHGALERDSTRPGIYLYKPEPNYAGEDALRFRVDDGLHLSNEATFSLMLTAVNDVPVARLPEALISPTSRFFPVSLLDYVRDDDGDPLHVEEGSLGPLPAGVVPSGPVASNTLNLDLGDPAFVGSIPLSYNVSDGKVTANIKVALKIETSPLSPDEWCEQADHRAEGVFASRRHKNEPHLICMDAGNDDPRVAISHGKRVFFRRAYPVGAPLEVLVRVRAGAKPALTVTSDDTRLHFEPKVIPAGPSHEVWAWRFNPEHPANQIRLDLSVLDKSVEGEEAKTDERQRTYVEAVRRELYATDRVHRLFPSFADDVSVVPDEVQVVPGGLLAISTDGEQVQAIADVISGDMLVIRLAYRGIAATVGQPGSEEASVGFLQIPSDMDAISTFRTFASGAGLYATLPVWANDWGTRAYGAEVPRRYNFSIGGRLGLQPSSDPMPFYEGFGIGQLLLTGRNNHGDPTLTIAAEGRLGLARTSPTFCAQMLSACQDGADGRRTFGYGMGTLSVGQAGGAKLGFQFYWAPAVGNMVPAIVLNYGS